MASDSSSNLEIIVSAVDEASGPLTEVGDSMQSIADQASAVSASVSESLSGVNSSVEEMAGVITVGTSAPIEDLSAVDAAFAERANTAQSSIDSTQNSFDAFMSSSAAAAQEVGASQEEIQAQMVATGQTAAEVASQIESDNQGVAGSYSDLTHSMRLMASGAIISGIGAAITAPVVGSIDQAAQRASTLAEGLNSIQDIINGSKGGSSQNASQIADITAKIANYRAAIAQANASMQENIGMTAVVEARHQKAAATIQQANVNIAKEEELLSGLTAKQKLGSASAQDISNQFQNMASQLTAIGLPFDTTYTALTGFLNVTGSVQGSLLAMNDAAGLVASGRIPDLQTAINAVTMAWQGMGRSGGLKMAVPDLQDGVAGMDALNQIASATQGSTGVAMAQLTTQFQALQTNLQDLGAAFGKDLVPPLTQLLTLINSIIEKVTAWAAAHPKLAASIVIVVGAIGGLLVALGSVLVIVGTLALAFVGLTVPLPIIGVSLLALGGSFLALLGPIALVIAAVVALGVIVTLIVKYHTQIWNAIKTAWGAIVAFFEDTFGGILTLINDYDNLWLEALTVTWHAVQTVTETVWNILKAFFTTTWTWVKNLFTSSLNDVSSAWNTAWNDMATFLGKIWNTIQNTIKTGVNDIITGINAFIHALDAIHISIPSIPIPGTKLGTPSINLGFSIPDLPMLADGGFVTQPTLALIGEAGPEAVVPLSQMGNYGYAGAGGGGQPIIININGGIFPADQSVIKQIGDMLARSVIQTLRVTNYQP